MAGKHDKNSPSQLKKRFMCPGSYQLELAVEKLRGKPLPDTAGPAAIRGIALHECVQPVVEGKLNMVAGAIRKGDWGEYEIKDIDIEHVHAIANIIRADATLLEPDDITIWEHQVDLTHVGIPSSEGGNRVDLCFVKPKQDHLDVYEFKFGRGYVDDPQWNFQVKAYAVGMRKKYGGDTVTVYLLQPDNFDSDKLNRSYTFTAAELDSAEEIIKGIVKETSNPEAPLCRGYHCEFCPVKGACPLWRDSYLNIPQHTLPGDYFDQSDEAMRQEFYENLLASAKWIKDAIEIVETRILGGAACKGYEVGEGRKSRKWTTEEAKLIEQFPSLIIEKLMSPAEAEKQHGKKFFRENLAEHVEDEPGKPKVVKSKP